MQAHAREGCPFTPIGYVFLLNLWLAAASAWAACPTAPCSTSAQCNDGNYCTTDTCIGTTCSCDLNHQQCDDGVFCDGLEFCNPSAGSTGGQPGSCQEGTPVTCTKHCSGGANYGQACTLDSQCPNALCTGFCSNLFSDCVECEDDGDCPTDPRRRCNASGECAQCTSHSQCQDGSFCNGFESCNFSTGLCEPGTPVVCQKTCFLGSNPGSNCTIDANCGTGGRCLGFCSNTKAMCVQCDTVAPRVCIGGPHDGQTCSGSGDPFCTPGGECGEPCQDANYCNGVEQCVNSACQAGTAPNCKTCVGGNRAGLGCATNADCTGTPPGTCTGPAGFCDDSNDRCQECLTDQHCNDGRFCTSDSCSLQVGNRICFNAHDNSLCNDTLPCNGEETCNAAADACDNPPDLVCGKTCFGGATPGAACTTDANCGKTCLGSSPPDSCTTDGNCARVCEGGFRNGEVCCTQDDCDDPGSTNDGPCLLGICVPGLCRGLCSDTLGGCVQCETSANCGDSLFCDGTETCNGSGQCAAGTPPNCESSGTCQCTQGACNEATDQCGAVPINNGTSCNDLNHCTANSLCSSGSCVNNPPGSNDPFRCVRLEWRPSTMQTITVGSSVVLSLYAVADGCNTASDDCPANYHPISGIDVLLGWTSTHLQLQPSIPQDPNPDDPCDPPSQCSFCQTCTGGSNPSAPCVQQCVGGADHGQLCYNATQCPGGGQCYSGPVCFGGSNNGNTCLTSGNCPGGICNTTNKCLGGGTCAAPTAYNWASSLFPNDCDVTTPMNGPCPSNGFPGNDGGAFYFAVKSPSCGSPPALSPAACATPAGLHITDIKFKALSVPPGAGTTPVAITPCGPASYRTKVTSFATAPDGLDSDALESIGPPATIRIVSCDDNGDCNDGDGCTIDACLNGSCSHQLNLCTDPDPCTFDYCDAGLCHHDPICESPEVCYQGVCYDPCATAAQCDDGVDCTVDTCDTSPPPPIDGICRHTVDHAFCDSGLFCSAEYCDLITDCTFDHRCFSPTGNPCPVSATCDEVSNTCGGCLAPAAVGNGPRYVAVTPAAQGTTPVALKVRGHCGDAQIGCVDRYVQSKCVGGSNNGQNCTTDANCPKTCQGGSNNGNPCATNTNCPPTGIGVCTGHCGTGTLGATPFYKTSAQWGTAQVRGTQLRPGKEYFFITECNFGPGQVVQSAAALAKTWKWGDVDNDSDVEGPDIAFVVNKFKGLPGSRPFENVNLWGCNPDDVIDGVDIASAVDSFKGFLYVCPLVCP